MSTKPMSTLRLPNSADVYEITDKKAREDKIDKDQGTENAGKLMAVGTDGKASLVNAPVSFDATYDENNKVLVLGGKSEIPGNVSVDPTLSETSTNAIQNQAVARKTNELSTNVTNVKNDLDVLKSRVDVMTSLEEGSTTGDAELQDIRVGTDGTVYDNAGEAVRSQINQLSEEIGGLKISAELTGALRAYFTNMQTLLPQLAYAIDENIGNALIENAKNVVIVLGGGEAEEPTLLRISAIYNGGIVPIGTALTDLTGIMVTGTYTDGSVSEITGYTLTGEIVEGNNTITVTYGGKTTTFTVPCYVYDNIYNYAHDNVLLSEQKDFVTATIYSGATEELTEDGLHLSIPSNTRNNSNAIKYVLIPDKVSCGILTAKVKINSVPRVVNTTEGALGFRLQLSNGSSGVQIYMCKNQNGNPVLYACEDNSVIEIGTFVIGTWYEITVELSTDGQYIFVNGEKIYSSDTLSSLYCTENRVIITAIADRVDVDTDVHVEYIAFKEDI